MKKPAYPRTAHPKAAHRSPRRSIVWKLFFSTVACLTMLLVLIWLLNNYALVSYYRSAKAHTLRDGFARLNTLVSQDSGDSTALRDEIYKLTYDRNVRLDFWNTGDTPVYGNPFAGSVAVPTVFSSLSAGEYQISSGSDQRSGSRTIMLVGRLDNNFGILMSTTVSAIEESVGVTNRFLLISGAAALVVSLAFALLLTRSFARPIRALSRVAGSVARLNFSDRYRLRSPRHPDEFDDLGSSINQMAAALEATVSNLKTANLQLMNDNELKTRQNEARQAFISNVSHELKTPISLIQTYAEGLGENIMGSEEDRAYYCGVIEDEAEKMGTLIKKMTMLMQLEAGSEELVIERFDMDELLHNMLQKHRPLFEQKRVSIEEPPEEPVFVWADEFLIENVLTNFLSNALHYVNDGGQVSVALTRSGENRVRVAVFNSGSHIDKEDMPRIWESFYKVDKARTRSYGGTGIGLSVVAAILNAHHMPYGVISREDGVEFYFELEAR